MPNFSISNIVSHITENNLLSPTRYEVIITGPIFIPEPILFNCHRCMIPPHSIATFDSTVLGPMRKIPNMEVYEDISFSFYVTDYVQEVVVMEHWLKLIGGNNSYRLAYYNDIVADMRINIYNVAGTKTATVNVYECYPIGISDVELSYAGVVPAELTVNWAYHSFELDSNRYENMMF